MEFRSYSLAFGWAGTPSASLAGGETSRILQFKIPDLAGESRPFLGVPEITFICRCDSGECGTRSARPEIEPDRWVSLEVADRRL